VNAKRSRVGLITLMLILAIGMSIVQPAQVGAWPFVTKKHVKKQIDPLTGRLNELEEISKQQAISIKDLDERTQAGINNAMNTVQNADGKAIVADQKATSASESANLAMKSVADTETRLNGRLSNIEDFHSVKVLNVDFKLNRSQLDASSATTLDELAQELKDSKGYVLEIQGFADPSGPTDYNLELSKNRASTVVRYLAEKHQIPLYRMRTIGMGESKYKDEDGNYSAKKSRRVEVRLLRNDSTKEVASNQ
jgi:outer membrane protein OmpA-like peptidoglycan-associated protein